MKLIYDYKNVEEVTLNIGNGFITWTYTATWTLQSGNTSGVHVDIYLWKMVLILKNQNNMVVHLEIGDTLELFLITVQLPTYGV